MDQQGDGSSRKRRGGHNLKGLLGRGDLSLGDLRRRGAGKRYDRHARHERDDEAGLVETKGENFRCANATSVVEVVFSI